MVRWVLAGLGGLFVIVLASCSESGLLTPLGGQSNQIVIHSVANGTMVTSGEQIPLSVSLNSSQATPALMKVELLSSSGTVVQTADIKNVDFTAPLPSVLLSDLQTGTYTLRLSLEGSDNQVLAQKKVSVFYVAGSYSLDGITSYPPALPPGGSGLIVARVTAPPNADPYLRWSMGDKLIADGYLAKGFDKIPWTAPSATGVYSITVEMYPFGPPPGGSFDFSSPYRMTVEIFVTNSAKINRNELGPPSSYYVLFHFEGNLKDSAVGGPGVAVSPIGNPTLGVSGSVFGYQLDGRSGFNVNSLLLPVSANGALEPASITMRLQLDQDQPNCQFFSTSTADGSFSLDMATNSQGELAATVNGTPEPGAVAIKSGVLTSITLSIVPTGGALNLLWFVDGVLSLSDSIPVAPTISSTAGSATIGGQDGFVGLIDEFGVYYRDGQGRHTTDPEIYRRAMTSEYGSNLLFAEGFDGVYLPPDLTYGGDVTRSQLQGGMLALAPGQSVSLPAVPLGEDKMTIDVALSGLTDAAGGVLTLSSKGGSLYSAKLSDLAPAGGTVQIAVSKGAGGFVLAARGQEPVTLAQEPSEIVVSISSTGKHPIDLRSFLIVKSQSRLASSHTTGSQLKKAEI